MQGRKILLGCGLCCSGLFSLEGSKDPGIPWPQARPEDVWMLDNPQRPQVVGSALLVHKAQGERGHPGASTKGHGTTVVQDCAKSISVMGKIRQRGKDIKDK